MQTIKAIYDGTGFRPIQKIPVKENYEVFITFVGPILSNNSNTHDLQKNPRSEFIGSWKDKIWISDNFNDPIEEMKEYME